MTAPTSEDLLIMINGQIATKSIPFATLRIVNERGKRVSEANMTVENGVNFGIAQWATIVIYSTDLTTVYFNGFIMKYRTKKRGIQIDYAINCSSVEILLQKAIVTGTKIGTDVDILADILADGYPDLSDMFDWTSDVTQLLLSDIDLTLSDDTLLDALDALSVQAGGAAYNQGTNQSMRLNMNYNPNLNAGMNFYGGTLPTGSDWQQTYGGTWNPNNVAWGSFGESTNGLRVTSQDFSGTDRGFLRIGRGGQSDALRQKVQAPTPVWLVLVMKYKIISSSSVDLSIRFVTYDDAGNLHNTGYALHSMSTTGSQGSWQTTYKAFSFTWGSGAFDPYAEDEVPANGWVEFEVQASNLNHSFTLDIDQVSMELVPPTASPPNFPPVVGEIGPYFDGSSSGAYWLGAARNSPSALGDNPLEWGTNRDAPFDVDIGNMDEIIEDLDIGYDGYDGINSVILTGGYSWVEVDWIYHSNNLQTHFDLEVPVYAADTFTQPIVYINIGTDDIPNWSTQTVVDRHDGFEAGNVLYDLKGHWLEFQSVPPDLKKGFRVVGRIKQSIRQTVVNEEVEDTSGLELVGKLFVGEVTEAEAFDIGQAELAKRQPAPTVRFTTYEPGLLAGDEIDIVDSSQSFSETLIIERVTRTYLGGGKGKFFVEAGRYTGNVADIIQGTNHTNEPKVDGDDDIETTTISYLVDQDASVLTDQDGNQILNIVTS